MSVVLSKYSKTKDISRGTVEYTSQREYTEALAKGQKAIAAGDFEQPYSFKQWKERNIGIIPTEEYNQYQEYLKDWYASRFQQSDVERLLKGDFIELLKNLKLVLRDDEINKWIEDIDFDDSVELAETIPYFARKLKEIAIYLVNKKEAIKKTKLKYNMAGTSNAIERLFYEYLLKAFTQRNYVLNVPEQTMWQTFPQLSAVKDSFQIFIEELYDDTSYFDKDPSMPVSGYFDLTNPEVTGYFDKIGFPIDKLEWLYQTGITPFFANNPLLWTLSDVFNEYAAADLSEVPLSAFDDISRNRLLDYYKMDLTQKYIGESQYIISGGFYIPKTKTFEYDFQQGNNWFYWPSGEYYQEIPNEYYDPISIQSTNLITDGASASNDYKTSDKIFIERGGQIEGAWLKLSTETTLNKTMSASIHKYPDSNGLGYQFRFPYSGYGLSAEDVPYTGPELNNFLSPFKIFDKHQQKSILNAYWNFTPSNSSVEPINIHDSNLIDSGANAGLYYNEGDKIFIRNATNPDGIHDSKPNSVYVDGYKRAWLYKFLKTDLPIKTGQNKIHWPVQTYESVDDINFSILTSQCAPIALSSVDATTELIGARAGYGLFDSDIIYKLDSPDGFPLECAFLSGVPINGLGGTTRTANMTGVIQPSFTLRCQPGQYETFIWQDSNLQINNSSIIHKEHQIDCPYLKTKHNSIYNNRHKTNEDLEKIGEEGVGDWKKCRCKAILYSPLGHPSENYNDYGRMADIIFVDTMYPSAMNFEDWRGTDGLPYNQSQDFAWFKLDEGQLEPDVGWGNGKWRTGAGTYNFTLHTGVLYKMLRSNLQRNPDDVFLESIPKLYIKQKHENTPKPVWAGTTLQPDGTWQKTTSASPMIINPGDYLMYDHMDSLWYCMTANDTRDSVFRTTDIGISFNKYNKWVTYNYVNTGVSVSLTWPNIKTIAGPAYLKDELDKVKWKIINPDSTYFETSETNINNPYRFLIEQIGTYSFEATGFFEDGTPYIPTITPNLSGAETPILSALSGNIDINTIYIDTLNLTWNHPLSGWDYTTNSYNTTSTGGRPLWVSGFDDESIYTKTKGTKVWSGGIFTDIIDEYTFITQPPLVDLTLNINDYIDYRHTGAGSLLWVEPLIFNIEEELKKWCKLEINPQVESPLKTYLYNLDKELIVSATDELSDISLYQTCDTTLFVNYWAVEPFTWTQELSDSSLGIPPTGGEWVSGITGNLIEPLVPYANLTNRHFPTIASMPYIGGIYETADTGGYFIPKGLGALTYLGQYYTNDFISNVTDPVYKTKNTYTSDYGLTKKLQPSPVENTSVNANWMRSSVVEGARAGFVNNTKSYQEFIPYQSKYESQQTNVGIRQITDQYDPWHGELDNIWIDETNFPPNFREEYPIQSWYNQFPMIDKKMSIWKTDIFGNNYGLFKDRDIVSQYTEKISVGDMWGRNVLGKISNGSSFLEDIYNKTQLYPLLYNQLSSNEIYSFDIIYDTIIFETPNYIAIQQLRLDDDTKELFSITDDLRIIQYNDPDESIVSWYAGHWFHEDQKQIILCYVELIDNVVIPYLYSYDINTNILKKIYDGNDNQELEEMESIGLTNIEKPIFTYNKNAKTYNISFISKTVDGMFVGIIDINSSYNTNTIFILPSPSISILTTDDLHLILTNYYNDKLVFTFEDAVTSRNYISYVCINHETT